MRTIDVFFAFPSVLLAIALSGALGAGIFNAIVSLTCVFVPQIARVAESVTTQIRARDYVDAAKLSGACLHHRAGAGARQRARPDLRLRHQPDQRLHDPRLRPVVPRPRRASARTGMGLDAQHPADGDLRQPDGGGPAGPRDLHRLDLVQPVLATDCAPRWRSANEPRVSSIPATVAARRSRCSASPTSCKHFPIRKGFGEKKAAPCARSTASASRR